jgi:hypothetical protein
MNRKPQSRAVRGARFVQGSAEQQS